MESDEKRVRICISPVEVRMGNFRIRVWNVSATPNCTLDCLLFLCPDKFWLKMFYLEVNDILCLEDRDCTFLLCTKLYGVAYRNTVISFQSH